MNNLLWEITSIYKYRLMKNMQMHLQHLEVIHKHKLTKYALAVNFFRWCSIARHLAVAGQSEGVDAVMEDGPSSSPEGGATGGRGLAPKRTRDSPTKPMATRE